MERSRRRRVTYARVGHPTLVTAVLALGCGPEKPEQSRTITIPDLRGIATAITTVSDSAAAVSQLGMVASARFVGTHLVALDIMPPFVKVYDSAGRFVHAFGEKGDGPREIGNPIAIAAVGDSALMTADFDGRLITWGLDGTVLAEHHLEGFRPMTMVSCGSTLLLYGPGEIAGGRTTWLRTFEGGVLSNSGLLADSVVRGQPLGYGGRPYGLIADDDEFALRHEFGPTPRLLTGKCSDPGTLHPVADLLPIPPRATPQGGAVQAGPPDRPAAVGLGRVDGFLVLGNYFRSGAPTLADTTIIEVIGDERRDTVLIPGRVILQDSRRGYGLLLSTSDPEPALIVVREADINPANHRPR